MCVRGCDEWWRLITLQLRVGKLSRSIKYATPAKAGAQLRNDHGRALRAPYRRYPNWAPAFAGVAF
jgi:hypothetical protein